MDEIVKPKIKRAQQVRLEVLDANQVRKLSRTSGIEVPYLLRQAVELLVAHHKKPQQLDPRVGGVAQMLRGDESAP